MPERASVTQAVQIGVETTPGTAVAADRLLNSLGIEPAVQVDMQRFRPMGQKWPSIITPGREWAQAALSGQADYNELQFLFASLLKVAAPSVVGTTGQRRIYEPAARAEDTVKTYTVEQGGAVRAHKAAYGLITEGSLTFTRGGIEIGGAMLMQRLIDNVVMTAAPTGVPQKPILADEIDVFVDSTSAGLGTTKMLRAVRAGWRVGDRFSPVWPLNSALDSFGSHVEREPSGAVTVRLAADAQGMAYLDTMRQGATRFIRIKCTSPDLAGTAIPFMLQIDVAGKVSAVSNFEDEDGLYAIEWTFDIVYDSTWAKAMSIQLDNNQAAINGI